MCIVNRKIMNKLNEMIECGRWLYSSYVTCMDRVHARHERGPRGGAHGLHVVVVEDHPVVGEGVQVRRRHLVRPMEAHVIPALNKQQSYLN